MFRKDAVIMVCAAEALSFSLASLVSFRDRLDLHLLLLCHVCVRGSAHVVGL